MRMIVNSVWLQMSLRHIASETLAYSQAMSTWARSGQRPLDQIRRHRCARHRVRRAAPSLFDGGSNRHALLEPFAHVEIKSDAVHVVVQRLLERCTKDVVVDAGEVRKIDIVVGECGLERRR